MRGLANQTLQSAADFDRVVTTVTVTEPRHPLFGRELRLLSLDCSRGPAFVAAALPDGRRRLLRRAATDLERPLASQATALPRISARTLLPLARHVRSMLTSLTEEIRHAKPSPSDSPVCSNTAVSPSAPRHRLAGIGTAATGSADCPAAAAPEERGGTPC